VSQVKVLPSGRSIGPIENQKNQPAKRRRDQKKKEGKGMVHKRAHQGCLGKKSRWNCPIKCHKSVPHGKEGGLNANTPRGKCGISKVTRWGGSSNKKTGTGQGL